jgi:hypothetical protein
MSLDPETLAFLEGVLEEAASESGTWSLPTYMAFRARIAEADPQEAKAMLYSFISLILDGATKPVTRYKLSQLCSAVHTFNLRHCEDVFREYMPLIRDMLEKLDNGHPLSRPITHLWGSLLAEVIVLPHPNAEHGRRLSQGAVRLCGRKKPRLTLARTPQPTSAHIQEE